MTVPVSRKRIKLLLAGSVYSHRSLRVAARAAGQDEEILRDMLWLLNAGEQLLGLKQVARNLLSILMTLRSLEPDPDEDSDLLALHGWDAVLRWVAEDLPTSPFEMSHPDENPNNRVALMRNPLWSSLWASTEDETSARQYRLLQGHFLLAHVGFLRRESNFDTRLGRSAFERRNTEEIWTAFAELPYSATLCLRNMASAPWTPIIAKIPSRLESQIFLEELGALELLEKEASVDLADWPVYRSSIRSYLAKAYGFERWTPRTSKRKQPIPPGRIRPKSQSIDLNLNDPDDPDTADWPSNRIISVEQPLPPEIEDEANEAGVDPSELADPDEHFTESSGEGDLQGRAIAGEISARGRYRYVQMSHQLLPFEYSIPALEEIRTLQLVLQSRWQSLADESTWTPAQRRAAESIVLTEILVWLGIPLSRSCRLVLKSAPYSIGDLIAETLHYDASRSEWIIPVEPPPGKLRFQEPVDQVHPHMIWCQGRSKSRPLGRSKRLPAERTINRDLRGCRAS